MNENRDWIKIIEDWKVSGKTQAEYCRTAGISASAFGYHLRKKATPERKKEFIEIPVKSKEIGSLLSLEVGKNGEIVIRIKSGS